MNRTHNALNLLNFVVTEKDADTWSYYSFKGLKKVLTRSELVKVINTYKTNPRAYSDTGLTYLITESNASVHSVQWSF